MGKLRINKGKYNISNKTFESLKFGDFYETQKKLCQLDIKKFAGLTGDKNPLHLNSEFAKNTFFKDITVNGMFCTSLIVGVVGTHLPGPGWFCISVDSEFPKPAYLDEEIKIRINVLKKIESVKTVVLEGKAFNKNNELVVKVNIKVKYLF